MQLPVSVLEGLVKSIRYIKAEDPLSKVILAGDFNFPGIDWRNGCLTDYYMSMQILLWIRYWCIIWLFTWANCFWTNYRKEFTGSMFYTHPNQVKQCYTLPGFSDHEAVVTFMTSVHISNKITRTISLYIIRPTGVILNRTLLASLSSIYN